METLTAFLDNNGDGLITGNTALILLKFVFIVVREPEIVSDPAILVMVAPKSCFCGFGK